MTKLTVIPSVYTAAKSKPSACCPRCCPRCLLLRASCLRHPRIDCKELGKHQHTGWFGLSLPLGRYSMQPDGNSGNNDLFHFPPADLQYQFFSTISYPADPYQQQPVPPQLPFQQQPAVPQVPNPGTAPSPPLTPLRIKLPAMAPSTRSATRHRGSSNASGSEYRASDASMAVDDDQVR